MEMSYLISSNAQGTGVLQVTPGFNYYATYWKYVNGSFMHPGQACGGSGGQVNGGGPDEGRLMPGLTYQALPCSN